MRIKYRCVPGWKKLAWVAVSPLGSGETTVHHGPSVETRDAWCIEGVWAGEFGAGDFDRTDVVAGSGLRIRGKNAVFVSAGNTVDRLWHCTHRGALFVSNSLPALLATGKLNLADDHDHSADMETVIHGLPRYVRRLPLNEGWVERTYFENLVFDGQKVERVPKPNSAPPFHGFDDYFAFLRSTSEQIGKNLSDPRRTFAIRPVVALSRGYDSPTVAVVARFAGCREAATILTSNSPTRRNDSGAEIARRLDLSCRAYDRRHLDGRWEPDIFAVMGLPDDMNLTLFDFQQPLTLLFTGFHGDKVWDRDWHELTDLERGDHSGSHFTEYRLRRGIIDCPVPYWGVQNVEQILKISASEEMRPWTLGNSYDRPIPRRIVETAGVPRESFGRKKSATIVARVFRPRSPELAADFGQFLAARGLAYVPRWCEKLYGALYVAYMVVNKAPGLRRIRFHRLIQTPPAMQFFLWANGRLRQEYAEALSAAPIDQASDASAAAPGSFDS